MIFPKVKGCKFYLVGGCVRDTVMKKPFNDYDYVVETLLSFGDLVKTINEMPNSRVYLEKKEFLTIRSKINGLDCDIAYPRKDSNYSDGRHPDKVDHVGSLKEDASRRDFTANALYMDESGKIYDFFGGLKDIKNNILRAVGDPRKRFKEDYLRILRGIRFAIQLGFEIETKTKLEMSLAHVGLCQISTERIMKEMNKCFHIDARATLSMVEKFNLWEVIKYHELNFNLNNKKVK